MTTETARHDSDESREWLDHDRQRELLQALLQAVANRVQAEEQLAGDQSGRTSGEDEGYQAACRALEQKRDDDQATVVRQYDLVRDESLSKVDAEIAATQIEYDDRVDELQTAFEQGRERNEQDLDEARWMVQAVLDDTADHNPKHKFETYRAQLQASRVRRMADWEDLADRVEKIALRLAEWRQPPRAEVWQGNRPPAEADECLEHFVECVGGANKAIDTLNRLWLVRMFSGHRPLLLWLGAVVALAAGLILGELPWRLGLLQQQGRLSLSIVFSLGTSMVSAMAVLGVLYLAAGARCRGLWNQLQQHVADAKRARQQWLKTSKREFGRRQGEFSDWYHVIVEERDNAIERIEEIHAERVKDFEQRHTTELSEVHRSFPQKLKALAEERDRQATACEAEKASRFEEIQRGYANDRSELDREHAQRTAIDREGFQRAFQDLSENWRKACDEFHSGTRSMVTRCEEIFSPWSQLGDDGYQRPDTVPSAIRLGQFCVDLSQVPGGIPSDERLKPAATEMPMPAILPFPEKSSLLLEADGTGRNAAVETLQTAMLRLLTSLPPGKLRFTIIDPVGLGDNFSAFMHLADFDELLVSGRIWTESAHIDRQLANLTEHMENVFQTYLRNQFTTIEQYNEYAGEVAEPYHVL
ncbi:MAG: hypothetical protein VB859_00015, partial [Planctomycetaceae bacterium]